jgi:hypothetical protein
VKPFTKLKIRLPSPSRAKYQGLQNFAKKQIFRRKAASFRPFSKRRAVKESFHRTAGKNIISKKGEEI